MQQDSARINRPPIEKGDARHKRDLSMAAGRKFSNRDSLLQFQRDHRSLTVRIFDVIHSYVAIVPGTRKFVSSNECEAFPVVLERKSAHKARQRPIMAANNSTGFPAQEELTFVGSSVSQ
jgi:hypothetical protein